MPETGETFSSVAALDGEDSVKFGFERPEMHKEKLSGTVDPYDRHVFLCYNTYDAWPARVEASDADPLPKLLADALKAHKKDIKLKTRLTICEGRDGTELLNGDVLIFPYMIKYRGLIETGVDSFVEDVLVNGKPWTSGVQQVLTGSHVFICAHNSRDRRCGVCGPALIEEFIEEIKQRGMKDQVSVSACSHVGGHKYAGNLIIFSPDSDGKVSGHWYGYVSPSDVSELLDQHIGKSEIIERIWSIWVLHSAITGSPSPYLISHTHVAVHISSRFFDIGAKWVLRTVKETGKVDEQKLPNGNYMKPELEVQPEPNHQPPTRERSQEEKPNGESCCQGDNGITCCREGTKEEVVPSKETMTSCCQGGTFGNSSRSSESFEKEAKKQLRGLRSWAGKWEQHEVLAAAGVIGAVTTAFVVYSLYKRSR